VASMAWARLCGEFNYGAKIAYFISLFLYMSLVRVRAAALADTSLFLYICKFSL